MAASTGNPIPLSLSLPPAHAPHASVWDPETAFHIRHNLRLLGDFVGTLPKHTAQSQHLSLPLVLSLEEVIFGVSRGWFVLVNDAPHSYAPEAKASEDFWAMRTEDANRQADEAVARDAAERAKRVGTLSVKGRGKKRQREEPESDEPPAVAQPQKLARLGIFQRVVAPLHAVWRFITRAEQEPTPSSPGEDTESCGDESETKAESARPALLEAKVRQQARATTLIITATAARPDEKHAKSTSIPLASLRLPRGLTRKQLNLRMAVFADLHDKGFYLSCGAKFGADFLAYAGSPQLFHAALAVIVVERDCVLGARDVVALGRLGDATRKRTVLAFLGTVGAVEYVGVQWEETLP